MTALTPAGVLDLADSGSRLGAEGRAMLLASLANPGATPDDCAQLPLGRRDALILSLRIRTFGNALQIESRCRDCGERLESALDLTALLDQQGAGTARAIPAPFLGEGREIRLPTSEDLAAVAGLEPQDAEWALIARLMTIPDGADASAIRRQAAALLAEADPLASIELDLSCPACGGTTAASLDIAACFWREIEAAAMRVAAEVHRLASAYGWSESDILAMSPFRRNLYLNLVST